MPDLVIIAERLLNASNASLSRVDLVLPLLLCARSLDLDLSSGVRLYLRLKGNNCGIKAILRGTAGRLALKDTSVGYFGLNKAI